MKKTNATMMLVLVALLSGCAGNKQPAPMSVSEVSIGEVALAAPGVEEYIWEEPMVDVIKVPPGLDPEGIYYRPSHQQVVEIRQGRWRYHRAANE